MKTSLENCILKLLRTLSDSDVSSERFDVERMSAISIAYQHRNQKKMKALAEKNAVGTNVHRRCERHPRVLIY
jgi:hypothetical protein